MYIWCPTWLLLVIPVEVEEQALVQIEMVGDPRSRDHNPANPPCTVSQGRVDGRPGCQAPKNAGPWLLILGGLG